MLCLLQTANSCSCSHFSLGLDVQRTRDFQLLLALFDLNFDVLKSGYGISCKIKFVYIPNIALCEENMTTANRGKETIYQGDPWKADRSWVAFYFLVSSILGVFRLPKYHKTYWMAPFNFKVLVKFGLRPNCSQKLALCSLARARRIFATARMLG